jgi:hypothetical protein
MQPTYLPWLGYFDLIDQVDKFVVYDDVQFVKQSWQHRNRIRTPLGLEWLTVPVILKGRFGQQIREVEMRNEEFAKDHLRAIELNYKKAHWFEKFSAEFFEIYFAAAKSKLLIELNLKLITWLAEKFGVKTPLTLSSSLNVGGKRTHRLAEICQNLGAENYLSPIGSAEYLLEELDIMVNHGIQVHFQNYSHPVYHQRFGPFLPFASAIDLLFNEGPGALDIIREGHHTSYTPDEVKALEHKEIVG